MNGNSVRIALGQILVEPGRPNANIARALAAIDRAAKPGADVLVLPECLDFGWASEDARNGAEPSDQREYSQQPKRRLGLPTDFIQTIRLRWRAERQNDHEESRWGATPRPSDVIGRG